MMPALILAAALDTSGGYAQTFTDAFAEACVPQRMSFAGTQETALAAGWRRVDRNAHPTLDLILKTSEQVLETDKDMQPKIDLALFEKTVAGTPHHLVVGRTEMMVVKGDPPWVYVGCYLYNFAASSPIDPAPVTALIGKPISQAHSAPELTGYLWGPPCPMPRTGDTYLTYVPATSPIAAQYGFTGLMLKFETSEPDPGEIVPETYC